MTFQLPSPFSSLFSLSLITSLIFFPLQLGLLVLDPFLNLPGPFRLLVLPHTHSHCLVHSHITYMLYLYIPLHYPFRHLPLCGLICVSPSRRGRLCRVWPELRLHLSMGKQPLTPVYKSFSTPSPPSSLISWHYFPYLFLWKYIYLIVLYFIHKYISR